MFLFPLAALLVLLPTIVSAAIFPPDTKVKMLDPKGFRKAMRSNVGGLDSALTLKLNILIQPEDERGCVCRPMVRGGFQSRGLVSTDEQAHQHCQRMAPEYSKAAENLSPLIPFYAVDCDAELNKRLCGEQVRIALRFNAVVSDTRSGCSRIPNTQSLPSW